MLWGIFPFEIVLQDIPFVKKLWAQKRGFKISASHMHFSGVNDPARINQELINCLLKGTVYMASCLLYFCQLVNIRTAAQSYNNFAGHYKFDYSY
jgi:hypothetical protein